MKSTKYCDRCGVEVFWTTSKAGNRYLAHEAPIYNADGRHIKTVWPAHRCEISPSREQDLIEIQRLRAIEHAEALAAGKIVKGQHIVVTKGRKVPIGTEGTVFWVADQEDGYGVRKAGFTTEAGDKHFININNISVNQNANY
jgi:hypothetical protein